MDISRALAVLDRWNYGKQGVMRHRVGPTDLKPDLARRFFVPHSSSTAFHLLQSHFKQSSTDAINTSLKSNSSCSPLLVNSLVSPGLSPPEATPTRVGRIDLARSSRIEDMTTLCLPPNPISCITAVSEKVGEAAKKTAQAFSGEQID